MVYFGSRTQNAVRSYQQSRGLSADGIVGCNTWRSLQEDVVRDRKNGYNNRLIDFKKMLEINTSKKVKKT